MIRRVMNNNALEIYEDDTLVMTLSERIKDGEMSVHISGAIKSTVAHELEDANSGERYSFPKNSSSDISTFAIDWADDSCICIPGDIATVSIATDISGFLLRRVKLISRLQL